MSNKYTRVIELVYADLRAKQENGVSVQSISECTIDGYFQELVRTKGHLSPIPLKLGTVNRYVETFLKGSNNSERQTG